MKYRGPITFKSGAHIFFYRLMRIPVVLLFAATVLFALMGAYSWVSSGGKDTGSMSLAVVSFVIWFLLSRAVDRPVRRSMRKSADKKYMSLKKYKKTMKQEKKHTSFHAPSSGERGEAARREEAHKRQIRYLNTLTSTVDDTRFIDFYSLAENDQNLRRVQNARQTLIDNSCRAYAVAEYAKRNPDLKGHVESMLLKEAGKGPVTDAVEELRKSVHYTNVAYYENSETTWRGTTLRQRLGGIKDEFRDDGQFIGQKSGL